MDSKARLLASLDALHDELAAGVPLDASAREKLEELATDIRRTLAGSPPAPEDPQLSSRLQEVVGTFEANHPQLTASLNRVADALANLGI